MSRSYSDSSSDSDWVQLTPPGEQPLEVDSTRYSIDVQDGVLFGGTQNPRPPTNPRPRPPRGNLSYLDGDSHRSIFAQYRTADEGSPLAYYPSLSDTSSMAMTAGSRATYYDSPEPARIPSSFSSGSTRRASGSSARTDSISSLPNLYVLEEDDAESSGAQGNLAYNRGALQCPLAFLGCREWFDDPRQWETHHQAHFRGRLPSSIDCPFSGCGERFQGLSSQDAWSRRWNHIVTCPYRTSGVNASPSASLIEHLWRSGMISSAQEQQLRQTGTLDDPGRYLDSSRDRRRERRPEDYRSRRDQDSGGGSYVLRR